MWDGEKIQTTGQFYALAGRADYDLSCRETLLTILQRAVKGPRLEGEESRKERKARITLEEMGLIDDVGTIKKQGKEAYVSLLEQGAYTDLEKEPVPA